MIAWVQRLRQAIHRSTGLACGLLFPPRCVHCSKDLPKIDRDIFLCPECVDHLGPVHWPGCQRCGVRILDREFAPPQCPNCRSTPIKFDAAVTLGGYHTGLREVILRMKRPSHQVLSVAIGQLLVQRRREQLDRHCADMIVPVPMFWTRRLRRGVNSPDIVARCIGESLGIPVRRDILVRHVNTEPQAGLSPSRRFENVRGAFRIRRPDAVRSARIMLVDDVLTTGATCSEAAKMLKRAGAAGVTVAVVARAQGG